MLFYDFEVFKYDWLVVVLDMTSKKKHVIINAPDELKALYEQNVNDIWVGFNSRHYDQYIFKAILCGFDPKKVNDYIIVKGKPGWQYSSLFRSYPLNNYDVMMNIDRGLKVFEGFMGTQYDGKEVNMMGRTAQDVLNVMRSWIGYSEANGKHKQIIDLYNSVKPLPRGYAVQYNDEWCDTTVSAAAIKAGCSELIGRECGVERHVDIFKSMGIWIEDGRITPQPGDIIVYNWDDATQPNDGYSDHIGYVEAVSGGTITAIEGNKGEAVGRRTIPVGWGYIRGFARPKYASSGSSTIKKSVTEVAKEVLAGAWGNGDARKNALIAAGYDYAAVQAKVNELVSDTASSLSKSVEEVAKEVIAGKWSNGDARKTALENAGYNYIEVQKKVNELCGASSVDYTAIAKEVIAGKWGNGSTRKSKLTAAGYDYGKVQAKVNEILS